MFFLESSCYPTNLMNPVASSTPSNSEPPSRTPLSVLPINHVNPNPPPTQPYSVSPVPHQEQQTRLHNSSRSGYESLGHTETIRVFHQTII